jgi:uncharacterized protein
VRILAIDGGGIRGLIPAIVLADLEQRTGRRTAELFDLIAGTSTGGILACGLSRRGEGGGPAFSAADLIGLYESEGPEIFHRSLLRTIVSIGGLADERYDDRGLTAALARYLDGARLSETATDLLVTAYEIERREAFFFRSARAREDPGHDFALVDVARATAAAPTYFEPARVTAGDGGDGYALVDGGLFALNPAMTAYADVAAAGQADEIELVVSLGTGSLTRRFPFADVRGWGAIEWAHPLIDIVFDGIAQTVDFELAQILGPERYVRVQTRLEDAGDALDDAGDRNLEALRREGATLVADRSADLDRVARALTSGATG